MLIKEPINVTMWISFFNNIQKVLNKRKKIIIPSQPINE